MGRVYIPNNKNIEEFSTNIAGAQIIDDLSSRVGADKLLQFSSATRYDTVNASTMLALHYNQDILNVLFEEHLLHNFVGSIEQLKEWLDTWIKFISTCDGYTIS
jgi:hypothetical protein